MSRIPPPYYEMRRQARRREEERRNAIKRREIAMSRFKRNQVLRFTTGNPLINPALVGKDFLVTETDEHKVSMIEGQYYSTVSDGTAGVPPRKVATIPTVLSVDAVALDSLGVVVVGERKVVNRSILDKVFGRPSYEIEYYGDVEVE